MYLVVGLSADMVWVHHLAGVCTGEHAASHTIAGTAGITYCLTLNAVTTETASVGVFLMGT
jgi:hypothetical protein